LKRATVNPFAGDAHNAKTGNNVKLRKLVIPCGNGPRGTAMRRTLTTSSVAADLGLSASAVQKYARDGEIPFEQTPGGHRRYDLDEVRSALYPPKPALAPLELTSPLGRGAHVELSEAARLQRDVRATASASDGSHEGHDRRDALDELFVHARRVLVSTRA